MLKRVSTLAGIIIIVIFTLVSFGGVFAYARYAVKNLEYIESKSITGLINRTASQTASWDSLLEDVVLKENNNDETKTDVYLKNVKSGREAFLITLSDVYISHYHPAEFHNGNLYIIRRTGGNSGYETNPKWTDELWKYNQKNRAKNCSPIRD